MDWKESLKALQNSGELPEGEEVTIDTEKEEKKNIPTLNVVIDRKGRKGKTATIIEGFDAEDNEGTEQIAKKLKQKLGTGGSARDGEILIQGERKEEIKALLKEWGYKVKG